MDRWRRLQMLHLLLLQAAACCRPGSGFAVAAPDRGGGGRWAHDPAPSKHLFVDHTLFAGSETFPGLGLFGDIGLVHHRPAPAGIVLAPSEPWESYGYIGYHSVVVAGPGEYRLYYDTGWLLPDRSDFHRYTCLATSRDGVSWTKPHLGVSTFMNSTASRGR
jgi:hypothetical protein